MLSNAQQALILSRRCKVAELLLKGISNRNDIMQRLGMEPSQRGSIERDIKSIKKEWRQSAIRDFNESVSIELAKLDRLEREYWESWEKSKSEKQSTRSARRNRMGVDGSAGGNDEFAEVKKEHRDGNPAFLDGVMKCIAKRCELLGLDQPKKVDATITGEITETRENIFLALSPDKIIEARIEFERLNTRLMQRIELVEEPAEVESPPPVPPHTHDPPDAAPDVPQSAPITPHEQIGGICNQHPSDGDTSFS